MTNHDGHLAQTHTAGMRALDSRSCHHTPAYAVAPRLGHIHGLNVMFILFIKQQLVLPLLFMKPLVVTCPLAEQRTDPHHTDPPHHIFQ